MISENSGGKSAPGCEVVPMMFILRDASLRDAPQDEAECVSGRPSW
jgi:hypothetical protein